MNQEIKPQPVEEKKCPKCGWRLDGQHLNPHCTACFAYAASFCYPEMKGSAEGRGVVNIRCFLGFHAPGPKWEIFYDSYCRCQRCGNILTGHFGGSDPDMYWRRDYADHPPSFFAMEPKPAQEAPKSQP